MFVLLSKAIHYILTVMALACLLAKYWTINLRVKFDQTLWVNKFSGKKELVNFLECCKLYSMFMFFVSQIVCIHRLSTQLVFLINQNAINHSQHFSIVYTIG